jgi:hypothetical protein
VAFKIKSGGTTISFVVLGETWDDSIEVQNVAQIGRQVASSLGGLLIGLHLLKTSFKVAKELAVQQVVRPAMSAARACVVGAQFRTGSKAAREKTEETAAPRGESDRFHFLPVRIWFSALRTLSTSGAGAVGEDASSLSAWLMLTVASVRS